MTLDMTLPEAIENMTGFEVLAAQRHFGTDFEQLGGIRTLIAVVYAYENRNAKTAWSTVEGRTLKELQTYFAAPDPDPDSDQGKDESPSEQKHGGSPRSVSPPGTPPASTTA